MEPLISYRTINTVRQRMTSFPRDRLVCNAGSIALRGSELSIALHLEPFELDGERIEEVIEFDGMELREGSLDSLVNFECEFPVNPDDGYVESSIYIWSVHNPIDLERIRFGVPREGRMPASIDLHFRFAFEGEAPDLRVTFDTELLMKTSGEQGEDSKPDNAPS